MNKEDIRTIIDAHNWLSEIEELNDKIKAKENERQDLWSLATKSTANSDGMPHASGVSDKVGNIVVKIAEKGKEIDRQIDLYIDKKSEIIATLELLPDNEYGTLHRYYVQLKTWAEVAREMNYSEMQVYRIKKKGLEHIVSMMEHLRRYGSIQ